MASQGAESKARGQFVGVFTLRTQESADKLSKAVSSFVGVSVDLFHVVKADEGVKADMLEDLDAIVSILESELHLICADDKNVQEAKAITGKIARSAGEVRRVFAQHSGNAPFTKEQEDVLRVELRNVLFELCNVSDFMEKRQQNLCLRIVGRAFRHLQIMKDTRTDYRLKEKLEKMLEDFKLMVSTMRRRAEVVGGSMDALRNKILDCVAAIEASTKDLIQTVKSVVASPDDSEAVAFMESVVKQMASSFATLIGILQGSDSLFASHSDFDYTSLEEALAALREAILAGNRADTLAQAQDITKQIRSLENEGNAELSSSVAALKGLTAKLLATAKANLQDPSAANQADMASVMDGMKGEAQRVVLKAKPASSGSAAMKESLLQCAQNLST